MLAHPSRQNPSGKLKPNSSVFDSDSDVDNELNLYGTTRGGRSRGQAKGSRARGGRGSRSRGATPSRGRVSEDLNLVLAVTMGRLFWQRTRNFFKISSGGICPFVLDRCRIL
jgi:hypothetical protein